MGRAPQRNADRAAVVRAPQLVPHAGMRADQGPDRQEVLVVENHRPVDAGHLDEPPLPFQRAGLLAHGDVFDGAADEGLAAGHRRQAAGSACPAEKMMLSGLSTRSAMRCSGS